MAAPTPTHEDTLVVALRHYNNVFRHRYQLPRLTGSYVDRTAGDALFADVKAVRAGGLPDASCAILARLALAETPRYAVGLITAEGRVAVVDASVRERRAFLGGQVLLTNPLGGYDNWKIVAAWFHRTVGDDGRRAALSGLASESRPDYEAIDDDLRARGNDGRATILPPSEAFSAERAAEVSYIWGVSPETLRKWKTRFRAERAARKAGAPRKNR